MKRSFVAMMKDLHRKYDFSTLILLKTKISGARADRVVRKHKFDGNYRVKAKLVVFGLYGILIYGM